nr:hypothetical protein [Tanacetum cinerariifolium]
MFDEYLEPPRAERPIPSAQAVQAPVNSAGTPSSTTLDQDVPSPSISPSSSALQSHSLHQCVAIEPNHMEDHPVAPVDNNLFVNVFSSEPHSEASSSGDINPMADVNVNAPAGQAPTMAPPVCTDDQILPRIRWMPIGKSNCYLDLDKSQSNPIYKIALDLCKPRLVTLASPDIVEPLRIELPFLEDQFQEDPPEDPPEVSMADNRTMAELLQAPTEARIWLEKEPPRSILTWDDLVTKFINQFFPPSKTTDLRNEITRFQQRFDESFYEAWDRFNDLLRACPHHGFFELHQLDTFYNALNSKSKVLQSRAKAVVAKVSTSSSTPAISSDVAELNDMVRALLLDKKNQSSALASSPTPAPVKAVELNCVTCDDAHSYQNCPATNGNIYRDNIQEYVSQAAATNYNQGNTGSGTLPSNTITNPKEDLKGITTRSGGAYQGPTIPIHSKVVKQRIE